MNIHLRPDQERQLVILACRVGRSADQIAQDAIDELFEHDAWFSGKVAEGAAELERTDAITHEEVGASIGKLLQS